MPQSTINLIPENEVKQKKTNPYVVWFLDVGIYFILFVYATVLVGSAWRWYEEKQLEDNLVAVTAKDIQVRGEQGFISEYQAMQDRYGATAGQIADYQFKAEYLKLIEDTIPAPVTLTNLAVDAHNISIGGYTNEYLAINQWVSVLEQNQKISSVRIVAVERNNDTSSAGSVSEAQGQVTFTLAVELQ